MKKKQKKQTGDKPFNVWMVSREYDGLAGAGGVKDVCRQLAESLVRHGNCDVSVVLPRYGFMNPEDLGFFPARVFCRSNQVETLEARTRSSRDYFEVDINYLEGERRETVTLWHNNIRGVNVYLVEAERFRGKLGVYTYTAEEEKNEPWQQQGVGHYDYFAMNVLLQKAALDFMILRNERPDVIHCHDGHAATLAPMMREIEGYRHFFRRTGVVVTIHNAGLGYHQEVADFKFARVVTGLPERVITGALLSNCFDPFLAAADYASLNTVSENYARELQETDDDSRTGWLGHRLLKKGIHLAGITNGIVPEDYDPEKAEKLGIAAAFAPEKGELAGKVVCKQEILNLVREQDLLLNVKVHGRLALQDEIPLLTFIGRLSPQKGVDVLIGAIRRLFAGGLKFQLLVLGSGDLELEREMIDLVEQGGENICFLQGYDPQLALKIYAAGDFFLIPSRYEPCGLTDYIAQLLGNLPIVHHVGGLVKVIADETGFVYRLHLAEDLAETIRRALQIYETQPDRIIAMQKAAISRIHERHTWKQVMGSYLILYRLSLEMAHLR